MSSTKPAPLAGVRVAIVGSSIEVESGPDGRFSIDHIEAGTYTLRARLPGYLVQQIENVRVRAARPTEVTFKLLTRLSQMVRAGDVRIMELSTLAASNRIYAELLRMAEPDAAGTGLFVIRNLPPLREIASRVGTTRETAARAMAQIYRTDIVRRRGRNLYLLDRAALEDRIKALETPKV